MRISKIYIICFDTLLIFPVFSRSCLIAVKTMKGEFTRKTWLNLFNIPSKGHLNRFEITLALKGISIGMQRISNTVFFAKQC